MAQVLLSIGAGTGQRPLIQAARRLGFDVVAFDRNASPAALDLLTEHVPCSTYDSDGVLSRLDGLKAKFEIVGVLARTSGPAVLTAAKVAEALELPGISPGLAQASVHKSVLRADALKANVNIAVGAVLSACKLPDFALPWIVKPEAPVVGKQNVRRLDRAEGFAEAFQAAKDESLSDQVIVERAIPGQDVGYMALRQNGQTVVELLYDEYVDFDPQTYQAQGLGIGAPSVIADQPAGLTVLQNGRTMLDHWGHDNGFAFCSFRVDEAGDVYLYEANPGLCGDDIADRLLPALWSGFDPFALDVQVALGQNVAPIEAPPQPAKIMN